MIKHSNNTIVGKITIVVLLIIVVLSVHYYYNKYQNIPVHVSIDDVEYCMNDLCKNQDKYSSVFNQPFFSLLRELHEKFDAKFTLYVYFKGKDGSINTYPNKFKEEMQENLDWLKFGFHSISPDFQKEETSNLEDFIKAYKGTTYNIENFSGTNSLSRIIRLHFWFATQQEVDYLYSQGITHLLSCNEENRESYSLSKEQCHKLYDLGSYSFGNMNYLRTELRIEDSSYPIINLLCHNERDTLVVFIHEWALEKRENKNKFYDVIRFLSNSGCKFLN